MPIEDLTTEEFGRLDYQVMSHVFESQNELGCLGSEIVYQNDLVARLIEAGFQASREVAVEIRFGSFAKTYLLDLVVSNQAVYELKATTILNEAHRAQLLNYLVMLDLSHGKLVNFKSRKVDACFVNNANRRSKRQSFAISADGSHVNNCFRELTLNMLRDWGTGLSIGLYQEALVHLLGGEAKVVRLIPMKRDSNDLGLQRFALIDDVTAFRLTAFSDSTEEYERQLGKLIAHSTLERVEWVNISVETVRFRTIRK